MKEYWKDGGGRALSTAVDLRSAGRRSGGLPIASAPSMAEERVGGEEGALFSNARCVPPHYDK